MSEIRIIVVGSIKEDYVQSGIREYMKRMSDKRINFIEVPDSNIKEEGKKILEKLEKFQGITIALDEKGQELTSREFSRFIKENFNRDLCFIIGGPDGLSKLVLKKVDHILALSRMTFNHEMARLFFVEQLYRAYSILGGKNYHR